MIQDGPKTPLSPYKVVDLTRQRAGPTAARQLADWGAQVIMIEEPGGDDIPAPRHGPDFQNLHRNKRSLSLNLKAPEGRDIFYKLAKDADVIVENYRPDVKHRLKIDYESVKRINPRIIYGSVSGFGQEGPYRDRPGVDQIAQGMGGLMSITGEPGRGPMRVGIAIDDLCSGIFCAMGILLAIIERERSGEGQWVQSSLLGAQVAMLDFQAARWLMSGEVAGQAGNNHPTTIPTGVFKTADGEINIACSGNKLYRRLCHALGLEGFAEDPDFANAQARSKNRVRLNAAIEAVTKTRTSAELVESLNREGVPSGPINRIDQVFADPQVRSLGIATPVQHPKLGRLELVGQPVKLSRTPSVLRTATPDRGQHTDAVLRELEYDDAAIAALRAKGVVA